MSSGLLALLDDVAGLAQVAAASLDDAAGQAAKAASKAAGVVIDDTAVTPRYVVGFAADRELPIIAKIALGSLRNKLLFLLPAALLLGFFAPWAITPLLMIGGVYLCYEGFEKVAGKLLGHGEAHGEGNAGSKDRATSARALEDAKVRGAIQTDFILSAEIMAITLANVEAAPFFQQAFVLSAVGIGVTLGVYGAVALIVKADDVGVALARNARPMSSLFDAIARREPAFGPTLADRIVSPLTRGFGRGLVSFMPVLLRALATVGTAAMLWVGGGILVHGAEHYGLTQPGAWLYHAGAWAGERLPALGAAVPWLVGALGTAVVGIVAGAAAMPVFALAGHLSGRWRSCAGAEKTDAA